MKIIGIDPGLIQTGYGIINVKDNQTMLVDYGIIKPSIKDNLANRLLTIYNDVSNIISRYNPKILAIEEVFYGKNVKSAMRLGQARGASMVAAASKGISIYEYSARKVKQSITGNGNAHKSQVQYMIAKEFNISNDNLPLDASDALGIALCHINQIKIDEL